MRGLWRAMGLVGLVACDAGEQGAVSDDTGVLPEPAAAAGPATMRRLTADQYRQVVADVFGAHVTVPWRLEPDARVHGLYRVGAGTVSVTAAGVEDYEAAARGVVAQVLDADHRDQVVPCTPAGIVDDGCARAALAPWGRRLWRRALTDDELDARVALATEAAQAVGDFHEGLGVAVTSLLLSPSFLFRTEEVGADGTLTPRAWASRVSFLLWNSTPDDALLDAVEAGTLDDAAGRAAQVDRMLADPRVAHGVRAWFDDVLDLGRLDEVRKDPTLFPVFDDALMVEAREQTLRTVAAHVIDRNADVRDLWTTRRTFLSRRLGLVYRLPVATREGFEEGVFPADGPRAGLLGHVSLLALHAHPGRSSPTLRGAFVREVLLCEEVPPPPPDVDFSAVESDATAATARERLEVHMGNPGCAACHALVDPVGLGLEQYDAVGAFRETEQGAPIDPSGELDGTPFDDAVGLGEALATHPALPSCLVDTLWRAAVGREATEDEADLLAWLDTRFAGGGHRWLTLVRDVATSEAFRRATPPEEMP